MNKKKGLIIGAVVVLVIIGAIWRNKSSNSQELPVISAEAAVRKPMEEELTATGQFVARDEEHLISRVGSRISKILMQEGDRVVPGDLILQLDTSELEKEKAQQLITLKQTRLSVQQNLMNLRLEYNRQFRQVEQLRDRVERSQRVYELGNLSEEDLRISKDSLITAEQALNAVKQQLNLLCGLPAHAEPILEDNRDESLIAATPEVARQQLILDRIEENIQHCSIHAGMEGRISSLPYIAGTPVSPGMELVLIQDIDSVEAEIWIDEVDNRKISLGDTVEVEADSILGITLEGSILTISPRIERIGSTLAGKVRVSLETGEHILRPGASCRALIHSLARQDTLTVPLQSVKPQGGNVVVFRLKENGSRYKLEEVAVGTGLSTLTEMEILSGLEEGDLIAVSEVDKLRNGMTVLLEGDS